MSHFFKKFEHLSPDSRVWIYQADRILTLQEVSNIKSELNNFVSNWVSHGASLVASADVIYNLFIVFAVDEQKEHASGCSIDKSVNFLKEIEKKYSVSMFNRLLVSWKENNSIQLTPLHEFEKLISSGKINGTTTVFNNLIETVRELNANWEVPLLQSWHKKLISKEELTYGK
jgi:hypothetical protein